MRWVSSIGTIHDIGLDQHEWRAVDSVLAGTQQLLANIEKAVIGL